MDIKQILTVFSGLKPSVEIEINLLMTISNTKKKDEEKLTKERLLNFF